jgi:hypothetical protein
VLVTGGEATWRKRKQEQEALKGEKNINLEKRRKETKRKGEGERRGNRMI